MSWGPVGLLSAYFVLSMEVLKQIRLIRLEYCQVAVFLFQKQIVFAGFKTILALTVADLQCRPPEPMPIDPWDRIMSSVYAPHAYCSNFYSPPFLQRYTYQLQLHK
jgi:hypothetical protein